MVSLDDLGHYYYGCRRDILSFTRAIWPFGMPRLTSGERNMYEGLYSYRYFSSMIVDR